MLTNKFKVLIFIVVIFVIALSVTSFIAMKSIEDAKKENEDARHKIEDLNNSVNSLEAALKDTDKALGDHEDKIKKYQDIFSAWSKATPSVNEAVQRIVFAYEEIVEHAHLFPEDKIAGFEDVMMDAVYGAIRSTDPMSVAKEFENMAEKLKETRFDLIFKDKIEKIKQNGVTFPEDSTSVAELRDYYNSFTDNKAVTDSFAAEGLDKELASLEAMLDADEENDLARAFENEVAAIKTPILPTTSLTKANEAWGALVGVLETDDKLAESTQKARALLDSYTARKNQLVDLTEAIRKEIDRLHTADPEVTHEEIAALNAMVDELLSLEVTIEVLNTDKTDYVVLLNEARLLPHKNDAFKEVKASYDLHYAMANNDRDILIALVEIKDATFNAIEIAESVDEIKSLVQNAKDGFAKCLN